jgi:hypothetical protein
MGFINKFYLKVPILHPPPLCILYKQLGLLFNVQMSKAMQKGAKFFVTNPWF